MERIANCNIFNNACKRTSNKWLHGLKYFNLIGNDYSSQAIT